MDIIVVYLYKYYILLKYRTLISSVVSKVLYDYIWPLTFWFLNHSVRHKHCIWEKEFVSGFMLQRICYDVNSPNYLPLSNLWDICKWWRHFFLGYIWPYLKTSTLISWLVISPKRICVQEILHAFTKCCTSEVGMPGISV